MKTILLFGAGKSATALIDYLLEQSKINNWKLCIADTNKEIILSKTKGAPEAEAIEIDITKTEQRFLIINAADIVISMMPPSLHILIANDCAELGKHFLTASYIDDDIKLLEPKIENKKILFLCEMGLDPGIDHMSAMKIFDTIRDKGGKIISFTSHCGGLIAPECDDNPWHYKISWNPKNIVLAGSTGAIYKEQNKIINKDYQTIFENAHSIIFPEIGELAWYANRDSLKYISTYKLEDAGTVIRTTLRYPSFCRGWDYIVNLGLTQIDDYDNIIDCETYLDWLDRKLFLVEKREMDFKEYLALYVADKYIGELQHQFDFLGLLSSKKLPKTFDHSADILQHIIEAKLAMQPNDKDMIVMLHDIEYELNNTTHKIKTYLKVIGDDSLKTAMAKTVGLPLGIATKLILDGTITSTGLQIPTEKNIYKPILNELEKFGIIFKEEYL